MPPKSAARTTTTKSRTSSRSRSNEVDQPMEIEEEVKTAEDQEMVDVALAPTVRSQRKRRATEPDNKEAESAIVTESSASDGRRSKRAKVARTESKEEPVKETKRGRKKTQSAEVTEKPEEKEATSRSTRRRGAAASPSPSPAPEEEDEAASVAVSEKEDADDVDEVDDGSGEDEDVNMEPASHWLDEHKSELWSNQLPSSIRSMIQDFISVKDLSTHFAAVSKDGYAMVRAYGELVSSKQQKLDDHSAVDLAAPETQLSFDDTHLAPTPRNAWNYGHPGHTSVSGPSKRCVAVSSGIVGARTEQSRITATFYLKQLCASPLRGVVVRLRADDGTREFGTLKIQASTMRQVTAALPGLRSLHCVVGSEKASSPMTFPPYLRQLRISVFFPSQRHLSSKERRAKGSKWKMGGWSPASCDQFVKSIYEGASQLSNLVAFSIDQFSQPGHYPPKAVSNDEWMLPLAKLINLQTLAGGSQFLRFASPGFFEKKTQVLHSLPRLTSIILPSNQPLPLEVLSACKHLKHIGAQLTVNEASKQVLAQLGSTLEVLRPQSWTTLDISWLGKMVALVELEIKYATYSGGFRLGVFGQPAAPDVSNAKTEFDPDELTDALVNLTRLESLTITCKELCGRHLTRLAAKLNQLRALSLTSAQLETLEWTSAEQVKGNKWPETLETLAIHAPSIPPADAHHLRSLRSLTSLSIVNSFSTPLKASQLFGLTVPSTFLPNLKQFTPRSQREAVPPEEVSLDQLEKQRAEMDLRARAGELKPAEGSASQQLAWMMQFLTNKEFCTAAATCRAWRGAASLPSAWGRYNTNSSSGRREGRVLVLNPSSPAFVAELIPQLALWKNATRVHINLPSDSYRQRGWGGYGNQQQQAQPTDLNEKPLLQLAKLTRIDDLSINFNAVSSGPRQRYLTQVGPKLRGATLTYIPPNCLQSLHGLRDLTLHVSKTKFAPGLELLALKQLNRFELHTDWLDGRLGEAVRQLSVDGQLSHFSCSFTSHSSGYSYSYQNNIREVRKQESEVVITQFFQALAGLETKLNPPPTATPTQDEPSVYEGNHIHITPSKPPAPQQTGWGFGFLQPAAAPNPPPQPVAAAAATSTLVGMADVDSTAAPVSAPDASKWTDLPRRPSALLQSIDLDLKSWVGLVDITPIFRLEKLTLFKFSHLRVDTTAPTPKLIQFDLPALEVENVLVPNLHDLQLTGRLNSAQLNTLPLLKQLRRLTLSDGTQPGSSDDVTCNPRLPQSYSVNPEVVFNLPHGSKGRPTISTATMIAFAHMPHLESLTFTRYDLKLDDLYHLKNSRSLTSLGIRECIGLPLLTRAELPLVSEPNEEETKKEEDAAAAAEIGQDDKIKKKKPTPFAHALEAVRARNQPQQKCPIGCQRLGLFDLIPGNDLIGLLRHLTNLKRFIYRPDSFTTSAMAAWTVERTNIKRSGYYHNSTNQVELCRQNACLTDHIVERYLLNQTPLEINFSTAETYSSRVIRAMSLTPALTNVARVSAMLGLPMPTTGTPWPLEAKANEVESALHGEIAGEIQAAEVLAQREATRNAYVPKKKKRTY